MQVARPGYHPVRGLLWQMALWGPGGSPCWGQGRGGEAMVVGIQAPSTLGSAIGGAERDRWRETFRIGWGTILQIG